MSQTILCKYKSVITFCWSQGKKDAQSKGDDWSEGEKRHIKEWQVQQRKYLDEIADLKTTFYNEIKVQLHMFINFSFQERLLEVSAKHT